MTKNNHALKEVEVRLVLKDAGALYSDQVIDNPEKAIDVMRDMLKGMDREYLCIVNVNTVGKPINYNVVSIGDLNSSIVSVQNVFKTAILSNAGRIILFHNHPSGALQPSKEDFAVTKRLVQAGKLLGITVLDHVIVGGVNGVSISMSRDYPDLFSVYEPEQIEHMIDGLPGIHSKENDYSL